MKKLLLTLSCAAAMTASAQVGELKIDKTAIQPQKVSKAMSAFVMNESQAAKVAKAPQRAAADGVYYKTPSGCMWITVDQPAYTYNTPYMVVAPWTEMMYENRGITKKGDWIIHTASSDIDVNDDVDENGNYWDMYQGGEGGYYGVTYTEGSVSYNPSHETGSAVNAYSPQILGLGMFNTFMPTNVDKVQYWWGGRNMSTSNLYGAGQLVIYDYEYDEKGNVKLDDNGDPIVNKDENGNPIISGSYTSCGVIYTAPKPMSPLYVEKASAWGLVWSDEDGILPIADKTLTMTIYNLENKEAEPIVLTCEPSEVKFSWKDDGVSLYMVHFSKKVLDESSGDMVEDPFVIDFKSEIHITGFDQEGVLLGLPGSEFPEEFLEDPEEGKTGNNLNQAYMLLKDDITGEEAYRSYSNTVPVIGFWSMFDKLEVMTKAESTTGQVFDHVNAIVVSDDGQDCGNVIFSNVEGVQVYTALDWEDEKTGEEMYWSDDMYDYEWIQNLTANQVVNSNGSEVGGSYYVGAVCDPLPADVKGRYAVIHLNGRGVVSDPIYILQGDITMEEILGNEGVTGDVNGDGVVNITDLNLIIDAMSGETVSGVTDINGDGTVNITDLNLVIDIMSGE